MSKPIFNKVFYYISETIPLDQREDLQDLLDTLGGTPVSLTDNRLTHFITPTLPLEEFVESLPEDSSAHSVTPLWVHRSAVLNSAQDPEYYYADPAFLFSGVVAAATDLSKSDCELISAAVTSLGGQWRNALTRDVTHLFAIAPGSCKYETAMHYREQTGVRVLVPHWFDDTVRLGIRDLPTRHYEWPDPRVFQQRPEGRTADEDDEYEPSPERMMLYETASLSNDEQRKHVRAVSRNVWKGKKLLLGLSLELSETQRKALYADIRRQGGKVIELSTKAEDTAREEVAKMDDADIFVTRHRTGAAYAKAYQQKKTIGTLAWLWYVRASGTLSRPADQLLHYPIPDRPADGFDKEVVTVTNYTGKDREYLKKLITLMGGEFTASMSAEHNTIVVAAYLHGTKTDKATSWSIPIVNHTWVEDCFVQWRRLTPAREKYIVFPSGVDFSTVLAERGIGRISWEPGQLEEIQRVAEAGANGDIAMDELGKAEGGEGLRGSTGEVEEAVTVDVDEGEVSVGSLMDVDVSFEGMSVSPAPAQKREVPERRKLVRRYTPRKADDEVEPQEAKDAVSPRDEVSTPSPVKRPAKTYGSAKAKRSVQQRKDEEDGEVSTEDEQPVEKKTPKSMNTRGAKAKEQPPKKHKLLELSSESDSDSTEEEMRSILGDLMPHDKGKARAGATSPAKTPKRIDSVLVPSVAEVYRSPTKQNGRTSPLKVGPPKKTAKAAPAPAPAQDDPAPPARGSKTKKQKPERAASPSGPAVPATTKPGREASSVENAEAGPSRAATSAIVTPMKVMRTPSKRSAATKASRKLHEVIMPDVVSFQKELKRGVVRGAHESLADAKGKTPAKAAAPSKGKKRPTTEAEDGEDEADEEEMPERKKPKTNEVEEPAKGRKLGRKSTVANIEMPKERQEGSAKKISGVATTKDVRVMTTQLSLSEDVLRGLAKLGAKIVTKPTECTHLLVKSVVRTEKFLCAMAVAPYVLGENWAIMSAANKKLLPEVDYAIKDAGTESKYHFTLDDALKRAKKNAGKLFGGITFYITPKVPVEAKLLKNVVTANGGQMSTQTPTGRVLAGQANRFVISCPEDVSIWRPLTQHHKIYTQELILTSALRQAIDWEDTAFQVSGSF